MPHKECEESNLLFPLRSILYMIGELINPCCAKSISQFHLYFWPNLPGVFRFWHGRVNVMGVWWTVTYNNSAGFCLVPLNVSRIDTEIMWPLHELRCYFKLFLFLIEHGTYTRNIISQLRMCEHIVMCICRLCVCHWDKRRGIDSTTALRSVLIGRWTFLSRLSHLAGLYRHYCITKQSSNWVTTTHLKIGYP